MQNIIMALAWKINIVVSFLFTRTTWYTVKHLAALKHKHCIVQQLMCLQKMKQSSFCTFLINADHWCFNLNTHDKVDKYFCIALLCLGFCNKVARMSLQIWNKTIIPWNIHLKAPKPPQTTPVTFKELMPVPSDIQSMSPLSKDTQTPLLLLMHKNFGLSLHKW